MFSNTSKPNKSSENLRITSQPINHSLPAAKSLRLPSPSPFVTPPSSAFSDRRTYSETLPDDCYQVKELSGTRGRASAVSTLLPPPEWTIDTREPMKRPPINGLFTPPSSLSSHAFRSWKQSVSVLCKHEGQTSHPAAQYVEPLSPISPGTPIGSFLSISPKRPALPRPKIRHFPLLRLATPCVDGSHESPENAASPFLALSGTADQEASDQATENVVQQGQDGSEHHIASPAQSHRSHHTIPDLTLSGEQLLPSQPITPSDEPTPLSQASPAGQSFPLTPPAENRSLQSRNTQRWPSVLLHRTQSSSWRQGNRITNRAADRYIPGRDFVTQARENYLLTTSPSRLSNVEKRNRRQSPTIDPFGRDSRTVMRSLRVRPAPTEASSNGSRPTAPGPSRVLIDGSTRVASEGAVWNIGGPSVAIDGVVSTSDGHGGRVASGTNAPMYTSAFLDQTEPSDTLEMHKRRLAAALDFDQANRVFREATDGQDSASSPTSPSSPTSSTSSPTLSVWKDSGWKGPDVVPCQSYECMLASRTDVLDAHRKSLKKKSALPIIPFRYVAPTEEALVSR